MGRGEASEEAWLHLAHHPLLPHISWHILGEGPLSYCHNTGVVWDGFDQSDFQVKTLERRAYCWEFAKELSANCFLVKQTYLIEVWVLKSAPPLILRQFILESGRGLLQRALVDCSRGRKTCHREPRFLYLNMAHISQNSRPTREKIRWEYQPIDNLAFHLCQPFCNN